jgi:hypothetical protein
MDPAVLDNLPIVSISGAPLLTGALVRLRAFMPSGDGERAELELQVAVA